MSFFARIRTKLRTFGAAQDEALKRLVRAGLGFLLVPLLLTLALSAAGFLVFHPSLAGPLDTNKLPPDERARAVRWLAGTGGGVFGFYLAVTFGRRLVEKLRKLPGRIRLIETFSLLSRHLSVLLALPFIAAIGQRDYEKTSPKLTLFFALVAALIAGNWLYELFGHRLAAAEPEDEPVSRTRWKERARAALAALAVFGLWAGYGYFFSRLAITNHHGLTTRTIDLGYYDNIFYQSLHGHALGCSFIKAGNHASAHFDPILVAFSPLYALYPRAEFLLVLQSVWLGAGAIPAYLLGRHGTASRLAGVAIAAVYCAYPALHGANMYEFHSLTLVSPVLLWLLYFLETRRPLLYALAMAVAMSIREDIPLLLCFVGFYAILAPKAGTVRYGKWTILVSVAYFAIVKAFFMESSGILNTGQDAYSFEYYYDAMIPDRNGIGGLVSSIVTNPLFALRLALEEAKIVFLATIFVPLLFVPFFARWGRVMLIYGLFFCLLASRGPVFAIHFQYTSILFPVAIALVPIAVRQLRAGEIVVPFGLEPGRLGRALVGATLVATLLVSWKFGGFVDNATFKGGFARVTRSLTEEQKALYAWVDAQATSIPEGASVGTTNRLGPHVSNRMRAFFYPAQTKVDYLFLDEGELKPPQLDAHRKLVERGDFRELSRNGKLALLVRRGL